MGTLVVEIFNSPTTSDEISSEISIEVTIPEHDGRTVRFMRSLRTALYHLKFDILI